MEITAFTIPQHQQFITLHRRHVILATSKNQLSQKYTAYPPTHPAATVLCELLTPFFEPKQIVDFALAALFFLLPSPRLLSYRHTLSMSSTGHKEISPVRFDCRRVPGIVVLSGMFEGACHAAFWLRHTYPLLSPRKITPSRGFSTLNIHERGLFVVHGTGTSGTGGSEGLGGRCQKKL